MKSGDSQKYFFNKNVKLDLITQIIFGNGRRKN